MWIKYTDLGGGETACHFGSLISACVSSPLISSCFHVCLSSASAEANQRKSNKGKNSWVNNVNKEAFMPPELFDVLEETEGEPKSLERLEAQSNCGCGPFSL